MREKAPQIEEAIFDRIRALEEAGSGPRQLQGLRGVYRLKRVGELLAGQIDEAPELGYPLGGRHLGIAGGGLGLGNPPPAVYQRIPVPRMEQMAATSK